MKIYDVLAKARRREPLSRSREVLFFKKHHSLLFSHPDFLLFDDEKDDFRLIVANIILQSILQINKLKQSNFATLIKQDELISFSYENTLISVPLFSYATNILINKNLLESYDINKLLVDFLETYNFALFESNFTILELIRSEKHTRVYYHYDFNTLYIINNQGRLDRKICLFDKYLKNPDYENIKDRVAKVLDAYYNVDQIGFIQALRDVKLISDKIYGRYIRSLGRRR